MKENPLSSYILNTSFLLGMVQTARLLRYLRNCIVLLYLFADFVAAGETALTVFIGSAILAFVSAEF